jgi:hypothetical protein
MIIKLKNQKPGHKGAVEPVGKKKMLLTCQTKQCNSSEDYKRNLERFDNFNCHKYTQAYMKS